MRNVSNAYIETMANRRDFYAEAEITFADGKTKTVNKKDFWLSGNSFTHSAGSSSFPLGMLIAKRITFSLNNEDDQWSEYDFFGAKIQLFTRFLLDDEKIESLNIGEFTVITPEAYGTTVEVTAMDESYKTDAEYSTGLTAPFSVGVGLRDSCQTCGITLLTTTFRNDDFVINSIPENITHRQFIGLCAMLAGGNAVLDEYNRLKIITYDLSTLAQTGLDGGQFDKLGVSKYVTGNTADGGSFAPWDVGYIADGGTFGDRKNLHVLYEVKSGMTVGVDDVVITGVQTQDKDGEMHLYGKEGYVISIENQLAAGKEDEVVQRIGDIIIGLRFRPFTAEHIAYPLAEFMDPAFIIDRKQNVYQTVLTDIEFNYFGFTNLKCTADSPLRNSSKFNSEAAKAVVAARKLVREERTAREQAVEALAKELANSSGLYITAEQQPDGSSIYYMHDKSTLEESKIVWKLTAEAFGISTDGGKTYPYGFDASGMAILSRIYAIGIIADYINAGTFLAQKKGKTVFLVDVDTGRVEIVADSFSLSNGDTIDSIAENKAKSAVTAQTQKDIFNKLTKNGTLKGIYMENGQLYISFDYAKGGELVLGGANNGNGILKMLDATGKVVGKWTNNSFKIESGDSLLDFSNNKLTIGNIRIDNGFYINDEKYASAKLIASGSITVPTTHYDYDSIKLQIPRSIFEKFTFIQIILTNGSDRKDQELMATSIIDPFGIVSTNISKTMRYSFESSGFYPTQSIGLNISGYGDSINFNFTGTNREDSSSTIQYPTNIYIYGIV